MMLQFVALLATSVVFVDGLRNEAKMPPAVVTALDSALCVEVEKAFKAAGLEVKCQADVLALLELRRLQVGAGGLACTDDPQRCARRQAKLLSYTHTVVPVVRPDAVVLHLFDDRGQSLAEARSPGNDFASLRSGLFAAAKRLAAKLAGAAAN